MSTENIYKKIIEESVLTAIDSLNDELSAGSNFRIDVEEGKNLNQIVSRAIAQQKNETVYSDRVKSPVGIYLNDKNNPSGHRFMVIAGFIDEKLYIVNPGIDGSIIDFDSNQVNGELIKNSLKSCFNI